MCVSIHLYDYWELGAAGGANYQVRVINPLHAS